MALAAACIAAFGVSLLPFPARAGPARDLRNDPCRAKLAREAFIRIVARIDANIPRDGTHRGKKSLEHEDEPDFRPLPVAAR
jgi:hypothetical protein